MPTFTTKVSELKRKYVVRVRESVLVRGGDHGRVSEIFSQGIALTFPASQSNPESLEEFFLFDELEVVNDTKRGPKPQVKAKHQLTQKLRL